MEFGLSYEFENFPPPQQLLYAINYEILACTDGCQLFQGSKGGGLMGDYSLTQQMVFSGGGGCSEFFIGDWLIGGGGESLFYDWYSPLANLPRTPLHTSFCIKSLLYKSNRLMLTF